MIRILHIGMSSNPGGVENFVMNLYRNIDRNKIQFDFLINHNIKKIAYEDEIISLGGNVYKEYYRRKERIIGKGKSVKQFFLEHPEINGVHMHANVLNPSFEIIKTAQKLNVPIRIVHSHNNNYMKKLKFKDKLYEIWVKSRVDSICTDLLACSEEAGKWMFGKKRFAVINNSIDLSKFIFNKTTRKILREKLKYSDSDVVIGTVTRLNYQKNPEYLINVFNEIYKQDNRFKLLIVGDGDLRTQIEKMIKDYDLENDVILVGAVNNSEEYLQAMDIFLFPSRFEGFGIALLEAQVAGLKCFSSNKVPKNINCGDNIQFMPLEYGYTYWVDKILETDFPYNRNINLENFEDFDIKNNIKKIERIYIGG